MEKILVLLKVALAQPNPRIMTENVKEKNLRYGIETLMD
jgi:hypothetical protein